MAIIKTNGSNLLPTFTGFSNLFDIDRFFENEFPALNLGTTIPAMNVKQNHNEYLVELAAPGLKKEDFKIDVDNNVLTIQAEKEENKEEKDVNYTRKEYNYNSFSRSFSLPETVKADKIQANYENGVLKLALPFKDGVKATAKKEIKVS